MKSKQVSKRLNNRRPNNAYLLATASRPRPQVRSAGSRGFAGTPGRHVEKKDGVVQGERVRADGVEASKLGACTKFNWETAFVRPHVRPFLQQAFGGRRRGTRCQDARAEAERPESPMAPSGRAQGGWARAQPGGRRGAELDPEVWVDSRVRGAGGRHSTLVAGGTVDSPAVIDAFTEQETRAERGGYRNGGWFVCRHQKHISVGNQTCAQRGFILDSRILREGVSPLYVPKSPF